MKNWLVVSVLISVFAFGTAQAQTAEDSARAEAVLRALNSFPNEWIEPITLEDIKINGGAGRVDVNKKSKFSYYIHVEEPSNPSSKISLIPMATSRYTPTYYQTDAWWDANQAEIAAAKREGRPAPRQDMNEVAEWLKSMKLSTNPLVFEIEPNGRVISSRLQDYLFNQYKKMFFKDGHVRLYRGGEKITETDDWIAGRRPRGVRYWTPTATYAWRYARKNPNFIRDLIAGRAPLYVFDLTEAAFSDMVNRRWPRLVLGTELTKNAHDSFDRSGRYMDHFSGGQYDFMGIGSLGVEFEIRSNSKGADQMVEHFKRSITIEELTSDRVTVLRNTLKRLQKWRPQESANLEQTYNGRIEHATLEGQIMVGIRDKHDKAELHALLERLNERSPEMTYLDGINFKQFAREEIDKIVEARPAEVVRTTRVRAAAVVRTCNGLMNLL